MFSGSGKRCLWCCPPSSVAQWCWCCCKVDWNWIWTKGVYYWAEAAVTDKSSEHRSTLRSLHKTASRLCYIFMFFFTFFNEHFFDTVTGWFLMQINFIISFLGVLFEKSKFHIRNAETTHIWAAFWYMAQQKFNFWLWFFFVLDICIKCFLLKSIQSLAF